MTNDERDVLHHIDAAQRTADHSESRVRDFLMLHIGTAIALAILEVARALRREGQ